MSVRRPGLVATLAAGLTLWLPAGGRVLAQASREPVDIAPEERPSGGDASPGDGEARGRGGELSRRFEAASPDLGERLPDVAVYDADGRRLQLRSVLEGHYSVVVFGCLT